MASILFLTRGDLRLDPRARRAARAAAAAGFAVLAAGPADAAGVCAGWPVHGVRSAATGRGRRRRALPAAPPAPASRRREAALVRELRGLAHLARWAALTVALVRAAHRLPAADVVHAHDLDTLPAGLLVARRTGARLVYDAHELATEQEADPPRGARLAGRCIERACARRAAAVVTVSDPIAQELQVRLDLDGRPLVVVSCPPLEQLQAPATATARGPLRAVYQGGPGLGRPLAEVAQAAAHAPGVRVHLRVAGVAAGALPAWLGLEADLAGAVGLDPVRPDEVVAALAGFDVGVIAIRPLSRNDELGFPNKLFEYLMAGLAVAAPDLPGLAPLVLGEGVGVVYEPGSAQGLGEALASLAADRSALEAMQRRARALAESRFSAERQASILLHAWGR